MLCYHALQTKTGWKPIVVVAKGDKPIYEGFPDGEHMPLWQADEDWATQPEALKEAKRWADRLDQFVTDENLIEGLEKELKESKEEAKQLRMDLREHLVKSVHNGSSVWDCTGTTTCDCNERRLVLMEIEGDT